ncbi:MAG: NADH dehydrogenase (ubiquinone) 30 kDa [Planctomycetota bacterium]|nr:MAG: NADH dehydrogenase (ubiquinone) 30 kDa [Planctomycetota bacterium]
MSLTTQFATLYNGVAAPRSLLPRLDFAAFRENILQGVARDWRVAALFALPAPGGHDLVAILAADDDGLMHALRTAVTGDSFPSLTAECPQLHLFEREIAELWGLKPEGHPWLKPVRFQKPLRPGLDLTPPRPGVVDWYQVKGDEIHEVAVGPVHAGVIEPGAFRFQCHGEHVFHLEISLGYQHRGVERAMLHGPLKRHIHLMETLAGDTTVGHTTAYCQNMEALGNGRAPARAHALRGIALELERLANHTGDLGALAGDVGFLPTMSFCGRLRGDWLNLTAQLCGSRFGRGMIRPGGVGFDAEPGRTYDMALKVEAALKDVSGAAELLWNTPSVMARFEDTGLVTRQTAEELGLVGPAARACGIERDARCNFPSGIWQFAQIPAATWTSGDVFARAWVRWLEIQRSAGFIREQLHSLPAGPVRAACGPPAADRIVVSLVEGWRGEICHVALTDGEGKFAAYKVVDPSFHNWTGLAMALRDQQISDFPLCNKSFNLSYCGHDL